MKKYLYLVLFIVLINVNFTFANTYNLSEISQARLVTSYSANTKVDKIDTVLFGSYPQSDTSGETKEPIEWIVLDRTRNYALLLSKYIIDNRPYNNSLENVTWESCTLRKWLNSNFINKAFTSDEKQRIEESDVTNHIVYNNKFTLDPSQIKGGNDTEDKVFCLSIDEVVEYFGIEHYSWFGYEFNEKCITKNTNFSSSLNEWMLRSPALSMTESSRINHNGSLSTNVSVNSNGGVRPAIWVKISSLSSSNNGDISINNSGTVNSGSNIKVDGGVIPGLPSRQSELRSDYHFYLDGNMQRSSWVYYVTYYYHVDANGNIEKSKWIEQRYVGADGRMYRGRQTPDGIWVGNDGLVVDAGADLYTSLTIEAAEPDSWYRTQSGLWYYFENDRTTTKRRWFKDNRDNQWYYLDPITGIMAVGWTNVDGKLYYFNESHDNEPNWYATGGGFYDSLGKKVKAYGSMFINEQTPDGQYVDANGCLITHQLTQSNSNSNVTIINNEANYNSDLSNRIRNAKLVTEYPANTTVDQMDIVTFGSYPQSDVTGTVKEPIEWIVLERQRDKALLISKKILDVPIYMKGNSTDWKSTYLREYLNNNFLNTAFHNDLKNMIVVNYEYNDFFGDRVFILNEEMLEKYFNIFNYTWIDRFSDDELSTTEAKLENLHHYMSTFKNEILKLRTATTNYAQNKFTGEYRPGGFYYYGYTNSNGKIIPFGSIVSSKTIGVTEGGFQNENCVGVRPVLWVSLSPPAQS